MEMTEIFMGSFPLTEVVLVIRFLESRSRIANSSKDMLTVDIRIPYSVIHIRNPGPAEPFSTFIYRASRGKH